MVVLIPVPDNTAKAKILVTAGKAKYDATKQALVSVLRPHNEEAGTADVIMFELLMLSSP